MAGGIGPEMLLPLRSKLVRVANSVKLNAVRVALMSARETFISETAPEESQIMEVQLQRLLRLLRDHEERGDGDGESPKLVFHLMRASA